MAEVEEINIYEGKDSILRFIRIYTKVNTIQFLDLHLQIF